MARATKPGIFNAFANSVSGSLGDFFNIPSYLDSGFPAPSGTPVRPPLGYFNWLFFQAMNFLKYAMQRGISDWDSGEDGYGTGDIVRSGGAFWVVTGTPTTGLAPASDPNNWQRWLDSPVATASAWAEQVWGWYNARRHRGHVINHQGILDGRILTTEEDWIDIAALSIGPAAANGNWFGRWKYGIFGDGGRVYASPPGTNLALSPWGPRAGVTIQDGVFPFGDSAAVIEMCRGFMLGGSSYVAMETAFAVNPAGVGTLEDTDTYALGFGDGTLVSSASVGKDDVGTAAPVGAYLVKKSGASVWSAMTHTPGGGGGSTTSLALVGNDPHRYRVEIIRAAASDDNVDRVIHYIDGAVVANHAVAMDGAMLTPYIRTAGQFQGPHVHSVLNVGRVRLTARLELGDVSI
jgi:hypothetical protein